MLLIACAARSAALAPGAARRLARRLARGAAGAEGDEDRYRGTVLLPETTFPQRASAKTKEPEIQACGRRAASEGRASPGLGARHGRPKASVACNFRPKSRLTM